MKENNKKSILIIMSILAVILVIIEIIVNYQKTGEIDENRVGQAINIITDTITTLDENEVVVSEETQKIVNETIESTENNEDLSTTEVIESSEDEEQEITDEGALENDAVVEQENISYDGDNSAKGLSLLGSYQGLTYYSQADSRWANTMYSSTNNSTQTMKSSACGPTSAAIVVSSSKGAILPTTMAQLFVSNNYRTANSGTAWSAYSFIADYFDFNEYHTTSNFNTAMNYLKQKDEKGNSKYYIIASCGSGLFTTGGHYIVLVANNEGIITIYDPYLYIGKFNTASRKNANVVVSGNSAFISEENFKAYANYKNFWIYSNDNGNGNTNTLTSTNTVNYTRYVATQNANLNVRSGPGTSYSKVSSLNKGTQVTVTEISGDWSKISSPTQGWVSSSYLSSSVVTTISNIQNTVGQTKKLAKASILYSNSNLTGIKYNYKANTTIKILKNISNTIDYVQVVQTGRKAYISNSNYTSIKITGVKKTTGQYKRLKSRTTLYKNSNLTGTKYSYLANTQVKIIKNINSNIDYVYVVKTGRYAYVRNNVYK